MGETADLRVLVVLLAVALVATSYCWGRAQYQLVTLKTDRDLQDWEPGRDAQGAEREGTASRPEAAP